MLSILLFFFCYFCLLRFGLGINESRVAYFNKNSEHRVCGNVYINEYVSFIDWCYFILCVFYIYQFGNKLLIFNKLYFLKRQILHSVSHPLRSQDSVSNCIQSNTERSKSGWRWVYLRCLFFILFFLLFLSSSPSFPYPSSLPPFLELHLGKFYI